MFTSTRIDYSKIPYLSKKDSAYKKSHPGLRPFYKYEVKLEAFEQIIKDKKADETDRATLVKALSQQYEGLSTSTAVLKNIESLSSENTFTVTTAHQPSLFTGPLYFIYKIISIIKLSSKLKDQYPDKHFVPIFVIGGEDHDFEEVNHAYIFNKKLEWQSGEKGSVGMMKTAQIHPLLDQLKELLGKSENAEEIFSVLKSAYGQQEHYGRATLQLVDALFQDSGLVVLDMNKAPLKRLFTPIIYQEVFGEISKKLIEESTKALETAGFSGQAHARDINFFYLMDQLRARITWNGSLFKVLDSNISFTEEEMEEEIEKHPERFSPNVIMRPLFQELILPNLAYIGGGGEIAYWLERKKQFEHFGINFPMLIRRDSALWIDKGSAARLNKLGFSSEDIFRSVDELIKEFVSKNSTAELSLEQEITAIQKVYEQIAEKAHHIAPPLSKSVLAELAKTSKSLKQLESRLLRAEKEKYEVSIGQIKKLKEKLFPNGKLQERHDNFLAYYLKYGKSYFEILEKYFDPLEAGFVIVREE